MKICSKCENKSENFDKNTRFTDGYDYWCRPCRRAYTKQHYANNVKKHRKETNSRRAGRIKWIANLKLNRPCKDCNKVYEPYCMDFDHLPIYNKVNSISRMVLNNTPKSVILKEIEKCDLVCILCHNRRTNARSNNNNKYPSHVIRNINIINRAKDKPCNLCGFKYKSFNMHFDHINPHEKNKNICQLKSAKVETLKAEMNKCQVLCALCHRRKSIIEQRTKNAKIRKGTIPRKTREKKVKKKPYYDETSQECVRCNEILPHNSFGKHKATKSGLNSWCKPCMNSYKRERRKVKKNSHPEV